jgi:hypothetical protein
MKDSIIANAKEKLKKIQIIEKPLLCVKLSSQINLNTVEENKRLK